MQVHAQAKSNEYYFGMNMLKLFIWYELGSGERSAKTAREVPNRWIIFIDKTSLVDLGTVDNI